MKAVEIVFGRSRLVQVLGAILVALILIAGKDLLHAFSKGYHFYLSESLLFGTYWLLFIPVIIYSNRLISKTKSKLHILLPFLLGVFHILSFAAIVKLISILFFSDPFQIIPVFVRTFSSYGFSSLIIYSVVIFFLKKKQGNPSQNKSKSLEILKVKHQNSILHIKADEIYYLKSETPYVGIVTSSATYLKQCSLKSVMKDLPAKNFIRVHKSYVINTGFIRSFTSRKNGDFDVVMNNDQLIRASRTYRENFDSLLH